MSMYECAECGSDYSSFPAVILSVNPPKPTDDSCELDFEGKYNLIYRENKLETKNISTQVLGESINKAWDLFHQWIGRSKALWFCSKVCALRYLARDDDALQDVDFIASGYEWICPKCDFIHRPIEIPRSRTVHCSRCNTDYSVQEIHHAYE